MSDCEDLLNLLYNELKILENAQKRNYRDIYYTSVERNCLNKDLITLEGKKDDLFEKETVLITKIKKRRKIKQVFNIKTPVKITFDNVEAEILRIEQAIKALEEKLEIQNTKLKVLNREKKQTLINITKILNEIKSNKQIINLIIEDKINKMDNEELLDMVFEMKEPQKNKIKK